jgi:hypothetical protein
MASVVYNSFKRDIMNGAIDMDAAAALKCMLVTSSYTPDIDAHTKKSDITNEVVGAGYTAGGAELTATVTVDNSSDKGIFDASDLTWGSSTITARGAVIYKDTGLPSTSPLICYVDFGTNKSSTNGDFTIQWASTGIITLS